MIELAPAMSRASLDHGWKVIALFAPHRAHHRNVIDHTADIWEPIRDGNAGLAVARESAQATDYGPLHLGQVVAETDGIHEFARPLVVFRIEGVNVTDPAAHEEEDDGFCFRRGSEKYVLDLARFRPQRAHGNARKPAAHLVEEASPGNPATRVKIAVTGHTQIHQG